MCIACGKHALSVIRVGPWRHRLTRVINWLISTYYIALYFHYRHPAFGINLAALSTINRN